MVHNQSEQWEPEDLRRPRLWQQLLGHKYNRSVEQCALSLPTSSGSATSNAASVATAVAAAAFSTAMPSTSAALACATRRLRARGVVDIDRRCMAQEQVVMAVKDPSGKHNR